MSEETKIRDWTKFQEDRKFDIRVLPADMQRVFKELRKVHGEEYALLTVFTIRTAVELHRAWHMTLLTSKILQQLKQRFRLRLTWSLGVFQLHFRISDGGAEIFRKVPYDYDSEYQDIYMRVAIALMDGEIDVHQALIYQAETLQGVHTAKSGLFLRDFPGRLVLYPLVAATCAVIFFNGDWTDFGIAALTGLASGLVEMTCGMLGIGMLTDIMVGTLTGIIGGLFYRYGDQSVCLSSIFLGTLYWFFYGTAFVLGILEIIAGELETGVTRFIAVSVKTFVLCLGACFGMMVIGDGADAWYQQSDNCGRIDLDDQWWRIPLYLLCSVAVLGQYRFPIVRYWRALVTMLAGYEVQYQTYKALSTHYGGDHVDTGLSNVAGCAAVVISACAVGYYLGNVRYYFTGRILNPDDPELNTCRGKFIHGFYASLTVLENMVGLGRRSDRERLGLEKKLKAERKARPNEKIELDPKEENVVIETIVGSQDMNIWCILMPALYQLVPGSMIAKLWFNYIFPPRLIEIERPLGDTGEFYTAYEVDQNANNVFAGLMVISTSLALGLPIGFAIVQKSESIMELLFCRNNELHKHKSYEKIQRQKDRRAGMYSSPITRIENPDSVAQELRKALTDGLTTIAQADEIFNAVDVDMSGSIDEGEVMYYMLKAGLSVQQIQSLFAIMDKDGNGEVSRAEFRKAILDKANSALVQPKTKAFEESPMTPTEGLLKPVEKQPVAAVEEGKTDGAAVGPDGEVLHSVSLLTGEYGGEEGVEAPVEMKA